MEDEKRQRVNALKKIILVSMFLMILIPLIICIYLLFKMNSMEKKIDKLSVKKEKQRLEQLAKQELNQKEPTLEEAAILEKDTTAERDLLTVGQATATDASSSDATTEEAATESPKLNGKKVYLTFDDGPSKRTDEILDILKEHNVKATFFTVAKDYSHSEQFNRIVKEGHALGIHSSSHEYDKVYANLDSFKRDVEGLHDLIYDMTGTDVKLYRFPGGSSNRVAKVDIEDCIKWLNDSGYTYFDWNSQSGDATTNNYTPEQLNDNVMGYVRNNSGDSVVLMHDLDGHPETVEALPALIETLQEEGYEILPITKDTKPVQHRTLENN